LKATLIVQLSPAGTPEPQSFFWTKSPLAAMLEMVNGVVPVFVSVVFRAALRVLTN
jgi:hypothetical protein